MTIRRPGKVVVVPSLKWLRKQDEAESRNSDPRFNLKSRRRFVPKRDRYRRSHRKNQGPNLRFGQRSRRRLGQYPRLHRKNQDPNPKFGRRSRPRLDRYPRSHHKNQGPNLRFDQKSRRARSISDAGNNRETGRRGDGVKGFITSALPHLPVTPSPHLPV